MLYLLDDCVEYHTVRLPTSRFLRQASSDKMTRSAETSLRAIFSEVLTL